MEDAILSEQQVRVAYQQFQFNITIIETLIQEAETSLIASPDNYLRYEIVFLYDSKSRHFPLFDLTTSIVGMLFIFNLARTTRLLIGMALKKRREM